VPFGDATDAAAETQARDNTLRAVDP